MGRGLKACLRNIFPYAGKSRSAGNGETRVLQPAHTIRLKPDHESDQPVWNQETGRSSPQTETSLEWCGLTDAGRVRDHNEDYFSSVDLDDAILFAVADGMGGHDAGETASRLAVETACREIGEAANRKYDPATLLERAVQRANSEVLRDATSKGSNMGTTLTLALMNREKAFIANVGDSRTYWVENGSIRRITVDHSLVAKLIAAGKLSEEEGRNHPRSNVLYRNIGSETPVKVDIFEVAVEKGGSLLLCSDGLWGELTDEDIRRVIMGENDARKTCSRLIQMANEKGGKDNITAVVVKVV